MTFLFQKLIAAIIKHSAQKEFTDMIRIGIIHIIKSIPK